MSEPVCAKPGDKLRCRYCQWVLQLTEYLQLADGTQTYWWTDRQGDRRCPGRKDRRGNQRAGGPWHRPPAVRDADPDDYDGETGWDD